MTRREEPTDEQRGLLASLFPIRRAMESHQGRPPKRISCRPQWVPLDTANRHAWAHARSGSFRTRRAIVGSNDGPLRAIELIAPHRSNRKNISRTDVLCVAVDAAGTSSYLFAPLQNFDAWSYALNVTSTALPTKLTSLAPSSRFGQLRQRPERIYAAIVMCRPAPAFKGGNDRRGVRRWCGTRPGN